MKLMRHAQGRAQTLIDGEAAPVIFIARSKSKSQLPTSQCSLGVNEIGDLSHVRLHIFFSSLPMGTLS
jgi:hypothetical protein